MKKVNVLIFVKSVDGGTGTFVLALSEIEKLFNKKNFNLRLIALEKPSYRKVEKNRIFYYRNKNFYPNKYTSLLRSIFNFITESIWLKKQIVESESNIIIGVDIHCNLLTQFTNLFILRRKPKVILTTHIDLDSTISDKSSKMIGLLLKRMVKFFYDKADVLVCSSEYLARDLRKSFKLKKKPIAIYDARDLMINKSPKLYKRGKSKKIITIARLTEQKDYPTLINAFSILNREFPQLKLLIASDGPQRGELEKMVEEMKLTKNVIFLGWVKDIFKYIENSDIFVFSSKREGFAYVLVEAMSKGIPVVSTNTPFGPSEVLKNGQYGLLVPVGDYKELAKSVATILNNKNKYSYYAKRSLERSKFFSQQKMIEEYKNLIIKL